MASFCNCGVRPPSEGSARGCSVCRAVACAPSRRFDADHRQSLVNARRIEASGARHRNLEGGTGLGAPFNLVSERSLPTAAQFDRQIIDNASVTSRLARDADRVSQIPFAADEPMQHDGAVLDRYRDMLVVEIRV